MTIFNVFTLMGGIAMFLYGMDLMGKEPRPPAKVPKWVLSGKGCGISKTTRMLAQKQPFIKRVRNSSLVERSCAENVRG